MTDYAPLGCTACQKEFSMQESSSIHFVEFDGKKLMFCQTCFQALMQWVVERKKIYEDTPAN